MIIHKHLIATEEIIGISPMNKVNSYGASGIMVAMFSEAFFLSFNVLTKQNTIEIKSKAFSFPKHPKTVEDAKEEKEALHFQQEYCSIYREIAGLVKQRDTVLEFKFIDKLENDCRKRHEFLDNLLLTFSAKNN
jgi:hypothetical protein